MARHALVVTAFVLFVRSPALADQAEEIVEGLSLFGRASSLSARVEMELVLTNGRKERTLDVFMRREGGRASVLVQVVSPAFLASMKLLTVREAGGEDSSWLKTSQGVRRLTDANSSERVFDSDFVADDFMVVSAKRFELTLLGDTVVDEVLCRTVQARPRTTAAGYARKLIYIGQGDGNLRGMDFLHADGSMVRRYRLLTTQDVGGQVYPLTAKMENLRAGTSSILTVAKLDTDQALPDRLFTRGNL